MCKQVIRDVDSCLVKLDKIFTENFLPEAKKKDFYRNARHIDTLAAICDLKCSIDDCDTMKNLVRICQMYQNHAARECTRRWNFVVYFGSAATIFASLLSIFNGDATTFWLVILLDLLVFVTLICAYQASRPTTREAFYALVVQILEDDTESSAIPPACPNNDCKTSTGDTAKENK